MRRTKKPARDGLHRTTKNITRQKVMSSTRSLDAHTQVKTITNQIEERHARHSDIEDTRISAKRHGIDLSPLTKLGFVEGTRRVW